MAILRHKFKIESSKFDLVITDMLMRKLPGDKLAKELIKIRPDISVLLCTCYSEGMTDARIKSIGIRGLLSKLILIKELVQKIRSMLDHRTIDK